MSQLIDRAKSVRFDRLDFPVKDAVNGDDPLETCCSRCGQNRRYEILGEITQHGLWFDTCVILVRCQKCMHSFAIRFRLEIGVVE